MKQENILRPGDLYRHFKGNLYQIITVAAHTETREALVIYQALYGDYKTYARPLDMFLSEVDREKYKDVKAKYRFEKVNREELDAGKPKTESEAFGESIVTGRTSANSAEGTVKDNSSKRPEKQEPEQQPQKEQENDLVNDDLLAFLDATSYEEKLEILYSIRKRVDEQLITNIEMSLDISGQSGTIEDRINFVKNNLQTRARFESNRLR